MSAQPIKSLRVKMPDGSVWDVAAKPIAEHRATYYAESENRPIGGAEWHEDVQRALGDAESLIDWAENNLNWAEVSEGAQLISGSKPPDYDDGWVNGPKEVVR